MRSLTTIPFIQLGKLWSPKSSQFGALMFAEQTSTNVSVLRDFKTTHPWMKPSASLERRLRDQNVFLNSLYGQVVRELIKTNNLEVS